MSICRANWRRWVKPSTQLSSIRTPERTAILRRPAASKTLYSKKSRFSAKSDRLLGVPLATVSRKVNDLEAHVGTKLLVRTTRKVAGTNRTPSWYAQGDK